MISTESMINAIIKKWEKRCSYVAEYRDAQVVTGIKWYMANCQRCNIESFIGNLIELKTNIEDEYSR